MRPTWWGYWVQNKLTEALPAWVVYELQRWFDDELLLSAGLSLAPPWVRLLMRLSGRQMAALTLGDTIYVRAPGYLSPYVPDGIALLAHELCHVKQFRRLGRLRFLLRYLREWLSHGYNGISLEVEAYAFQQDEVLEALHSEREMKVV